METDDTYSNSHDARQLGWATCLSSTFTVVFWILRYIVLQQAQDPHYPDPFRVAVQSLFPFDWFIGVSGSLLSLGLFLAWRKVKRRRPAIRHPQ